MAQSKILVICGSLRTGSLNRAIAETLPDLAPAGMTLTMSPSIGDMPIYDADIQKSGVPDGAVALGDAIREADGVIFVSPEYNYSVPGGLKNAIDWVSRLEDQPLKGKPVAIQSAAAGVLGGARMQYHLRQILVFLEAMVFNKPEVFVTFAGKKIENGRLTDEATRDVVSQQLAAFAEYIARVSPGRDT